ncbi:MAG TPA: hypothetical protein VGJ18_18725 [Gemmatimonadaceae bacterium]|jgi:hypothetical protein
MGTPNAERRDSDGTDFTGSELPAIGAVRTFAVDGQGWTVREVSDPLTHATALVFSSDRIARRIRHYPPNWRELSVEQLHALSWQR